MEFNLRLDISAKTVIDEHCHPFTELAQNLTKEQFISLVSIGGAQYGLTSTSNGALFHPQNLAFYRVFIKKLSKLFSCPPEIEEIIKARNERSKIFRKYITKLFADANIETLMMDDGYSEVSVEHKLPEINFEKLAELVPVRVARIKRLEPLIQKSLDESSSFEELVAKYDSALDTAVKKQKCIAFKSITAYRTGLDILRHEEEEAREEYRLYKEKKGITTWFGPQAKKLREYLICYAIEKSVEFNIPFQIHTGIGDTDVIFERCNPRFLFNLLKDEKVRHAKIVLVHGGYPYTSEAAYLTNAFPNVYMDVSIIFPFAYAGASARILNILELAPISKVMYGSDGFSIPELHWVSAKVGKEILGEVLGKMVQLRVFDEDEAYKYASMILSENARRLYKLD
ncbi:MAG: amidohydrolase family protein [Candidatus Bathyarchaeia archaeon]